jgi:hypothetical protein
MYKKGLLLVFAAAATIVLAGCELFWLGSYTISGTITAHTYVPADSVDFYVYQWSGPGLHLKAPPSVVVDMPDPDPAGYSKGTCVIRNVFPNSQGLTTLTAIFRSPTAPAGATATTNGGPRFSIIGPPWSGPDIAGTCQFDYGVVNEPHDMTIDIDLGS